jgi:hypothetical protein
MDVTDMSCEQYRDLLAELALGVSDEDEKERTALLGHIEGCLECQRELKGFAEVADRLIAVAPQAEPPAGFESKVLASFVAVDPGARSSSFSAYTPSEHAPSDSLRSDSLRSPRSTPQPLGPKRDVPRGLARPRWPRRGKTSPIWPVRVLAAVAAAVLIAGVGAGGFLLGRSHAPAEHGGTRSAPILAGDFVSGGQDIGQAIYDGGAYPWVAMWVDVPSAAGSEGGEVSCQVRLSTGRVVTIGSYRLDQYGNGYWAAAVPAGSGRVIGAQLVDGTGRVIAVAEWR